MLLVLWSYKILYTHVSDWWQCTYVCVQGKQVSIISSLVYFCFRCATASALATPWIFQKKELSVWVKLFHRICLISPWWRGDLLQCSLGWKDSENDRYSSAEKVAYCSWLLVGYCVTSKSPKWFRLTEFTISVVPCALITLYVQSLSWLSGMRLTIWYVINFTFLDCVMKRLVFSEFVIALRKRERVFMLVFVWGWFFFLFCGMGSWDEAASSTGVCDATKFSIVTAATYGFLYSLVSKSLFLFCGQSSMNINQQA